MNYLIKSEAARFFMTLVMVIGSLSSLRAIYVDIGKYNYEITRFWGSGVNGDTQALIAGIAAGETVSGDIVIPDSITYDGNKYPVVGIGEGDFSGILEDKNPAFYKNTTITSISIPATIRFIGSNEFLGCTNIEKYEVAAGNKDFISEDGILYELDYSYDQEKFNYRLFRFPAARNISTLPIPAKATSIGAGAFAANNYLKVIILSGEQSLDDRWQLGNRSIENVDCKSSTRYTSPEEGVLVYGNTFKGVCPGLVHTTYSVPENIRYIAEGAFCESDIKEITFPESVVNPLAQYAFLNSSVEKINFEGTLPFNVPQGCFINARALSAITLQGNENGYLYFSTSCFLGCRALEKITFENNVKNISISRYAFKDCSRLAEFPLTSKMKVSELNSYAFSGCRSLTSFAFSCVTEIEDVPGYEFEGSGLTYVNWPSTFTKVPYGCFKDCKDLTKINLKMTTTDISADAFSGSGLTAISLMGVEWYAHTAFYNCQNLSRVYFPVNDREYVNYRDIGFIPPTCEVIVNNPRLRNLDNQFPNHNSEVKLYMSDFSPTVSIGDAWSYVYVPGRSSDIYGALTHSEIREMFRYSTDKKNSKVKISSTAAGVRITGVTIEGVETELKDGWWEADCEPSSGNKMNVEVRYTVYGNPMQTRYEYQFEDVETGLLPITTDNISLIRHITNKEIQLYAARSWEIFDLWGRIVLKGESETVDISSLPSGMYLICISASPALRIKFIR